MDIDINLLVEEVVKRLKEKLAIPIEASGRHVHLSREHLDILFGKGYELTRAKDLSQPGQYACKERVMLIGPKGRLNNVAILGPTRGSTQVEISKTDEAFLGLKAPVRESGKIEDSEAIIIATEKGSVAINEGVIIAKRHIHINSKDQELFNVKHGQIVRVKAGGDRPLVFHEVVIRVSDRFSTRMHIDYDEANALGYRKDSKAYILD